MKFLVELLDLLTASTPILPDYPDTTRLWNNIGFELRNCEPISKFNQKLLSFIRPQKSSSVAYMTDTESEFSFNLELASVYYLKRP